MIFGILTLESDRNDSNQRAYELGIDPEGTMSTFCVPVIPDSSPNSAIPTHWGCCGALNEPAAEWVEGSDVLLWWKWDDQTNELIASHDGLNIGESWDFEKCLSAVSLRVRPVSMP